MVIRGQICLCGERIFIQSSLYDRFKEDFVKETKKLKVNNPLSKTTNQGSIVSRQHFDKIITYLKSAKKSGAIFLTGGKSKRLNGEYANGWYIEPTIIENLDRNSQCYNEEAFGPVTSIHKFDKKEDVIKLANETKYGLAASIWTTDLSTAHHVAKSIDFGIVWVNSWNLRDLRTPFGGMKESGLGREGGDESLTFFSEPKKHMH